MRPAAIDRAATLLKNARFKKRLLDDLPETCRPRTIEEAYAIQDRLVQMLGDSTGGWFLGCTNIAIQHQLGLKEPYYARLLQSSVQEGPYSLQLPKELSAVLELEFAFKLSRDIPATMEKYSEKAIAPFIASVHPAIEVVIGYLRDWTHKDIYSIIADNGTDGILVYGEGVSRWQSLDLNELPITLSVNGNVVREGKGSNVLDGPLSAMTWLANHCDRSPGLRAGHINNTGSCTPMYFANPGDVAIADFGPLGTVTLEIDH